jgi:hypothetical protein
MGCGDLMAHFVQLWHINMSLSEFYRKYMRKWPSAVATYYMSVFFWYRHPVWHCWFGNPGMNTCPGSFLALGHSSTNKSLVLSSQSFGYAWDRHQSGRTLDHRGDAGSSRYVEVSDNDYVYVFIKSQCIGQKSSGVSTCRQLRVRFPRVICPWSRSLIRKLNCRTAWASYQPNDSVLDGMIKGIRARHEGKQEITRTVTYVYCMCRAAWSRIIVKVIVTHVSKKLWAPVYPRHSVYKTPLLVLALRLLNSVCSPNPAYSLFLFVFIYLQGD